MKKYLSSIFALLIILSITACATTQEASVAVSEQPSASVKNKKQNTEKLRFDDWKYKGFGQELPVWVTFAVNGDNNNLKKIIAKVDTVSTVTVLAGCGENADQADQAAKDSIQQLFSQDENYKYYDSFWVRENVEVKKTDKPYKAVYVYYK